MTYSSYYESSALGHPSIPLYALWELSRLSSHQSRSFFSTAPPGTNPHFCRFVLPQSEKKAGVDSNYQIDRNHQNIIDDFPVVPSDPGNVFVHEL